MGKTDPFSIRLDPELYNEVMAVIGATEGGISKSGLIALALRSYLALLRINPGMLEDYDISRDRSVARNAAGVTRDFDL